MEEDKDKNGRKPQLYVLQLSQPKNLDELKSQLKHVVDHFYEHAGGGCVPVAFAIEWLLEGDGALDTLCGLLSDRWGEPRERLSMVTVTAVGLAARTCELKLARQHLNADGMLDEAWLNENTAAMSWTVLCAQQVRLGLHCNCALCAAVYIANRYELAETDLKELFRQLRVMDEDNDELCMHKQLERIADRAGWKRPKTQWGCL